MPANADKAKTNERRVPLLKTSTEVMKVPTENTDEQVNKKLRLICGGSFTENAY